MAAFSFETITSDQAAAFGTDDYLFFLDSNASSNKVMVEPFTRGSLGTGINLTYAGKTVTFPNSISAASEANHIQFNDNTHLQIGTQAADATFVPIGGTGMNAGTQINTVYALNGDDTINFAGTTTGGVTTGNTGNGVGNYLNGGFGSDSINGGNGSNHIYGNSEFTQSGALDENNQADGQDTITVGTGTNYINGNAGNDVITINGNANTNLTGNNVVRGGADDDSISINGGGVNSVNGNTGNDVIVAGGTFTRGGSTTAVTGNATFNNTLHGGQGNDTILAGHGHDQIFGDLGSDSLVAGTNSTMTGTNTNGGHLTVMTGGAGGDTFDFSAAGSATGTGADGSASGTLGTNIAGTNYYQQITDFEHGIDQIRLGFSIESGDLVHQQAGVSFTTVSAASNYAQGLLANHTASTGANSGEVAAVQVGSDTFLFYHGAGGDNGAIDSVIQLHNVDQSTLSQGSANSTVANGGNDFIFTASTGTSGGI